MLPRATDNAVVGRMARGPVGGLHWTML